MPEARTPFADDAGLRIVLEHVGHNRLTGDSDGAPADVKTLGGFRQAATFTVAGRVAYPGRGRVVRGRRSGPARLPGHWRNAVLIARRDYSPH